MKKVPLVFFVATLFNAATSFAQTPTVLYATQTLPEHDSKGTATGKMQTTARPFVMYSNGIYTDLSFCNEEKGTAKEKAACAQSKILLPGFIKTGIELYILNNGKQSGTVKVTGSKKEEELANGGEYAILSTDPKVSIITNDSKTGLGELKAITSKPVLKTRKFDGYTYKDKLLTKVDIDNDGSPELIYESGDYEGVYIQIFSFINNQWKQVFSGGYEGA